MPGFLLACLHGAGVLAAAGEVELKGRVLDPSGGALAGVTLVLVSPITGTPERNQLSDAAGNFRFPGLAPARGYRLRASLSGYATVEISEIDLEPESSRRIDVVLRDAREAQEVVRVRATPPMVDTESVVVSTRFDAGFIAGLPLLGRDYQDILTLAPGVTDLYGNGNPNIHGARSTDVLTLVDGMNVTDPLTGFYGQNLNIESIGEIEVITSGATPAYGRAQGGFVNIVTKSGGNEFRGNFQLFVRTSRLDHDGAGADPTELHGGFGEDRSEIDFTDLRPFVGVSGPLRKDQAWYYLTNEFIQIEAPRNYGGYSVVERTRGLRGFAKVTWQLGDSNRLAASILFDKTRLENLGLTSLTDPEAGYTYQRGGPTYALRDTAMLRSNLVLESAWGWFDNRFFIQPTLDPDTNHNGILSVDDNFELGGNGDRLLQARESDPGEDWDQDRAYDLFEDVNGNDSLDLGEDLDRDGRLTPGSGCEGPGRDDRNCNGVLDREIDLDSDGFVDSFEDLGIPCPVSAQCPDGILPGTADNGVWDTEDLNGNGRLDTIGASGRTPFPFWVDRDADSIPDPGEYRAPLAPDRQPVFDASGRVSGPFPIDSDDHRPRFTWREELSWYLEGAGSHDLKIGATWEKEDYARELIWRPLLDIAPPPPVDTSSIHALGLQVVTAYGTVPANATNAADGDDLAVYFHDQSKPLANLTLGFGVRLDWERLDASGYAPFVPWAERADYDALAAVFVPVGNDRTPALCRDPLYQCTSASLPLHVAQIFSELARRHPVRMTRHQAEVEFASPQISRLLGLNLGLQEVLALGVRPRRPESFEIENLNVAPRLSVAWDPGGDGRTKLFASWGRYYDKLFLGSVVQEQGPDEFTRAYFFDQDGVDFLGRPDNRLGAAVALSPPSATLIDRGLSTPYSDEWSVGFAREIAPEVSVQVTYVRRDYQNQLQDVDINHRTRIDPGTGGFLDEIGDTQCYIAPIYFPGARCSLVPDGLPDLYNGNLYFNRILWIGNTNSLTYRGWEVELVRRLRRRWQMEGSYTFSRAAGDAESYLSELGNDPSVAEFERGYLDYDERHVVKFNAIAFLPRGWQIGGTARWGSGLPYSVIDRRSAQDDAGYTQFRLLYGAHDPAGRFLPESRNSRRNHPTYEFNARVQKRFAVGRSVAAVSLEVFNLLNDDHVRILTLEPTAEALQIDEVRDFGRRIQIGFQLDF